MKKNTAILIPFIIGIILIIFSVSLIINKEQSNNKTVKIVYVNDIDWLCEGGILSGTFADDELLSIDIRLYRSMFQTNEKYYISSDVIFYEKTTFYYNEPMDTSSVSFNEEYYIILDNEVYLRKYDEEKEEDIFIKDEQNTDIITRFIEYKELIEEKFNS